MSDIRLALKALKTASTHLSQSVEFRVSCEAEYRAAVRAAQVVLFDALQETERARDLLARLDQRRRK